jgi:hypothetical protein
VTHTAAPSLELADVLSEIREDAAVLRRRAHTRDAELLEQMADRVSRAASDLLTWWSEEDAAAASGWSLAKVRKHARQFAHTGHVRYERRRYYLRAAIVPRALPASIARAAGERAA